MNGTVWAIMPLLALSAGTASRPAAALGDVPPGPAPVAASAPAPDPSTAWAPSHGGLAELRRRIGHREIRVWVGESAGVIRDPLLSSAGVGGSSFEPFGAVPSADPLAISPAALPVSWERVDRIEVRRPHALVGAALGAFLGIMAAGTLERHAGSEPGPGIVIVLVIPPASALLGGIVGNHVRTWEPVWRRGD